MTAKQKTAIQELRDNHYGKWSNTRYLVSEEMSDRQPVKCVCGRLATGLHETNCKRFQDKVSIETAKRLSHLLVKV